MKYLLILTILLIQISSTYSQKYKRKRFDYAKMKEVEFVACEDQAAEELERAFSQIKDLNSKGAVETSEKVFKNYDKCAFSYEAYALALFKNGQWMEAIEIVDKAIEEFGAMPGLILRRAYMSYEMGDLGIGVRNIDGSSVYLGSDKKLKYKEEKFKSENYKSALHDLVYLISTYQGRYDEVSAVAEIYQILEDYDNSNLYYSQLLEVEEYKDQSTFAMVTNYLAQGKYMEAEKSLNELEEKYPTNAGIQEKFEELYRLTDRGDEIESRKKKSEFYNWVPDFVDLPFTDENYEKVLFFLDNHTAEEKTERIEQLVNNNDEHAIDLLIVVLYVHANHANGVESRSEELLIQMGDPVVEKVIALFNNANSTCTITKSASVLAEIKDPRGWQALIDYLPNMNRFAITTIPPEVPAQLLKFDREKGLIEVLRWLKTREEPVEDPDDPLAGLGNIFSAASIYGPLEDFSKEEVTDSAQSLGYTEEEIGTLIEKIYGKE